MSEDFLQDLGALPALHPQRSECVPQIVEAYARKLGLLEQRLEVLLVKVVVRDRGAGEQREDKVAELRLRGPYLFLQGR